MEDEIRSIIGKVKGIHSFSSVIMKINTMITADTVSIRDIALEIEKEPSLSANVLRLANSSYYGFSGKVSTISMAMTILGLNTVRNLIMAVYLSRMFLKTGEGLFDPASLWLHSLGCAVSARTLLRKRSPEIQEMAFVCGLLHDIGKVVLAQVAPQSMEALLLKQKEKGEPFVDIELQDLGYTHSRIGAILADTWHFPERYTNIILHHHHAPMLLKNDDDPIGPAVFIGNQLAKMLALGKSTSSKADNITDEMWHMAGVDLDGIDDLIKEIKLKYSEIRATLNLD